MDFVVLHDHLDGGLRPATLVELASEPEFKRRLPDFSLPSYDPADLARHIADASRSGSLVEYLKTFEYTVAVMQTPEALERVAAEAVEDLAADGVVYAEIRFAPGLHTEAGLSSAEAARAVLAGLDHGMRTTGGRITARALVCTLRHWDPIRSVEAARLALDLRGDGVVGFDIAGPEAGFPAYEHRDAFAILRDAGMPFTIHAGEAAGPESIDDAVALGARRLGHGVRVVEDIRPDGSYGPIAERVRGEGIVLETCPYSNVHTGAVPSLDAHPLRRLVDEGFAATVNTDNRLMSATSMPGEFEAVRQHLGFTPAECEKLTATARAAAFS